MPNTPLQMLLRGQNLLGYRHYEDGVVDRFVAEGGRERHGRLPRLRRAQRHPQPAAGPSRPCGAPASTRRAPSATPSARVHTIAGFVELAEQLRRARLRLHLHQGHGGAAQAAAGLRPGHGASRTRCGEEVRVHVHVHATTGVTLVSLMKAIEAGADCVDTAISSMSLGPGPQPDRERWSRCSKARRTRPRSTRSACSRSRTTSPGSARATRSSSRTSPASRPRSSTVQIPGGMISNMESQLKQQGAGDRMQGGAGRGARTCAQTPASRRWSRPSSQIVGTQAVFNVMMGRYKVLTGEFADLMLGYYGDTIGAARPGSGRTGAEARAQGADHLPAGRPAEAGVGRAARAGARARRAATAPTRTCSPTPCSRRWRRSSSPRRQRARRTWARKRSSRPPPSRHPRRPRPATKGTAPVRTALTYDVKLDGQTHKVTVTPA